MTIIVTMELSVTLDSIRNSCDVLVYDGDDEDSSDVVWIAIEIVGR